MTKRWRRLPVRRRDFDRFLLPNNRRTTGSSQSIRVDRYNTLRQRLDDSDFDIDIKDIPSLTDRESNFWCLRYPFSSRFVGSRSNEFGHGFTPLPRRNDPSASTSSQTNIHSVRFPSRLENDTSRCSLINLTNTKTGPRSLRTRLRNAERDERYGQFRIRRHPPSPSTIVLGLKDGQRFWRSTIKRQEVFVNHLLSYLNSAHVPCH